MARDKIETLESLANDMLNTAAQSRLRTRNSHYIALAEDGAAEVAALIEDALARGELSQQALFDRSHRPIAGSEPTQYQTGFTAYADLRVRPLLDRHTAKDATIIGCCLIDMDGYLPTHISARRQPQRIGDPRWNMEHARNRQIFMDAQTRRALDGDDDFYLFTYRQNLGEGRYRALRSVFVPLRFAGRRWGLYEVGYLI